MEIRESVPAACLTLFLNKPNHTAARVLLAAGMGLGLPYRKCLGLAKWWWEAEP